MSDPTDISLSLLRAFKKRILAHESVIGPFMKTGDPAFVESAGWAGFDFAILDLEHGPGTIENMQNLVRAAIVAGILPIIRVQGPSEEFVGRALDIGALGIQVPQINTGEQAEEAIASARFHPEGQRGVCRFVRAAQYSAQDRFEFFKTANEALIILQLEGQEGLKNLNDILAVEGIDILFIGPYDLSQSLGVPGQIDHPKVIEQMEFIVAEAKKKKIAIGTFLDRLADISKWKKAGVQYLSYSVDVGIFVDACRVIVGSHKKISE